MTPKIVDKDEKRRHIMRAALQVFSKRGLSNTKMTEIAETAGIGKGTIYEYFKSKEDLFIAASEFHLQALGQVIDQQLQNITNPSEKLRKYFIAWADFTESDFHEFADVMLDFWAAGIRGQNSGRILNLNKLYRTYRNQIKIILSEGIEQGIFKPTHPDMTASIIIGTIDGLLLQWILDRNIFDIRETFELLAAVILDGLTPLPQPSELT